MARLPTLSNEIHGPWPFSFLTIEFVEPSNGVCLKYAVANLLDRVHKIDPCDLALDLILTEKFPYPLQCFEGEADALEDLKEIYLELAGHMKAKSDRSEELMHDVFALLNSTIIELALDDTLNCQN